LVDLDSFKRSNASKFDEGWPADPGITLMSTTGVLLHNHNYITVLVSVNNAEIDNSCGSVWIGKQSLGYVKLSHQGVLVIPDATCLFWLFVLALSQEYLSLFFLLFHHWVYFAESSANQRARG
jgi:hypothetical protein